MSDVVVSVVESVTAVTVSEQQVDVAVTESPVVVSTSTSGPQGAVGAGVPTGGSASQILVKNSATDYDTGWVDNITQTVQHLVKNDGVALSKGNAVYISGASGTNIIVSKASNTSDALSAETIGLIAQDLAVNAQGYVITEGLLSGFNTSAATAGDPVWLGVNGALIFGLANKPVAPAHLVFLGVVTRAHATQGEVFVRVSNGWELDELHNVLITSASNGQVLAYDSASGLWKNQAVGTASYAVTSGTAVYATSAGSASTAGSAISAGTASYATTSGTAVYSTSSGSATNANYATTAGTAVYATTAGAVSTANYATTSGTAVYATTSGTAVSISGSITRSQVSDFASGTVASAAVSGTATYATTSGTATYATTSGTAVSISGSITKSQVSDFTSGTVAYATSAGSATTAGSAVVAASAVYADFANTAGTAVYATTSGTAVSISGSITASQVSGTAVITTDSRLSDSRTPTAHASTHASAGSDPVTLAQSQVTNLTSDLALKAALTASQTFTGTQTLIPAATNATGLIVKAISGQATTLFAVQNSGGTNNLSVNQFGLTTIFGSASISPTSASSQALIIKGAASQSANLLELQDSASTVQTLVSSSGQIASNQRATFGSTTISGLAHLTVAQGNAGRVSLGLQNTASSNTGDLASYFNVSSAVIGGRNANAQIYTGSTAPLTTQVGGATTAASGTGTVATITTTSNHNLAVGDRITVAGVTPTGYNGTFIVTAVTANTVSYANATTGSQTVAGTVSVDAQASVTARSAGTIGLIVRAAASQASRIQSWQNSSGTELAYVQASGQIVSTNSMVSSGDVVSTGGSVKAQNGLFTGGGENSGGFAFMTKQNAAASNPGAGIGKLYFRDGTNAGTLKLVVRAGAAGAETTILDNIPQ